MKDCEYRLIDMKPIKQDDDTKTMRVEGRAIVYDQPTLLRGKDGKQFREVICRGALDGCNMQDVPLRYNHNIKGDYPILARTRNKSLELTVDDQGLMIRANLLDDKIYNAIQSGLLDSMSFGFPTPKKENVSWITKTVDGIPERRIKKIDKLVDVSVVDSPAYQSTSIYARSLDLLEEELRSLDNDKNELEVMKLRNQIKSKK